MTYGGMNFDQSVPAPGWYYADGDPLGTHRYWDGAQWVGGPQPVAGGVAPAAAVGNLGGWGERFVAAFIDWIIIWGPFVVIAGVSDEFSDPMDDPSGLVVLLAYGWALIAWVGNKMIMQGTSGQTVGKKLMKVKLVSEATGAPPGIAVCFGRHLVASILVVFTCYIYFLVDYLWPLGDDKEQRVTDKMFSLLVVKSEV